MEKVLILMKGISCASKSTRVEYLKKKYNAVVLSSDELREINNLSNTDSSVFKIIDDMACEYLNNGKSVIIDSMSLSIKKHRRYEQIAKKTKSKYICNYVITHPYIWTDYAKKRIKNKWKNLSFEDMLNLRQQNFKALSHPFSHEFDEINYDITDIFINNNHIIEFKSYYEDNKELFISNTEIFMKNIYKNGLLEKVIPEIYRIYNYDQENMYHTLTLDKHTFKVCSNISEKSEINIWSALLHDIGKVIDGIKTKKPTGDYSYLGHAGASSEMAMCILKRLGFDMDFCERVSLLVNKHMYLPYDGNLKKSKIDFIGLDFYETLVDFRRADANAK